MNYKPAPYAKRFFAFIIDWYAASLFASIPVILMQSLQAKDLVILNRLDDLSLPFAWIGGVLALLIYSVYYCVIPGRGGNKRKFGQTFGRQLLKIQLVKTDATPLRFKDLFIRDFLCVLLAEGYLTSANIYIMSLIQMSTGSYIVPYFQAFYYAVIAVSLLMLLFGKRKQMLHDLLSRTRMIDAADI